MSKQHLNLVDLLPRDPVAPSILPRRLFHLFAGSIMPTFILFAPHEPLGWGFIIASAVVISGELIRGLLPTVNDLAIRYLPFFKAKERYEVTGSTFLVLTGTLTFFIFDKEFAALSLYFLAVGQGLRNTTCAGEVVGHVDVRRRCRRLRRRPEAVRQQGLRGTRHRRVRRGEARFFGGGQVVLCGFDHCTVHCSFEHCTGRGWLAVFL